MSLALSPPHEAGPPSSQLEAPAAAAPPGLCFGAFPITEHSTFPPPDDPAACWIYLTLNAEIALSLPHSPILQEIIASPRARISVDGQWLWWALRRKYSGQAPAKLSGSDLIHRLGKDCQARQRRLLLLGSTPALNAAAVAAMRRDCPLLAVAGFAPAPYAAGGADEAAAEQQVLQAVDAWQPDYVVLGLGAAKEQRLAWRLQAALSGRVRGLLCFGGAIDLASGRVRRAPRWWQLSGLEGLYRVWQQPQRLGRLLRVLRILPVLAHGRY